MKVIVFLVLVLCSYACKTNEPVSPETYTKRQIVFGNGGGFTGMTDSYVLLENGQLFNERSVVGSPYNELARLDENLTKQLFENFYNLGLNKSLLNDPGNLTYFVKMKGPDTEHNLTWGGVNQTVNPNIKKYYMNLFTLAQRQKKAEQKQ